MIYLQIVDLIKRDPEKLALHWSEHIRRAEVTRTYRSLSVDQLVSRHTLVFQNLALWLQQSLTRADLSRFFQDLGAERYRERFPLCEVNYALLTAKRDFWELIRSQGLLDSALEFYQAMELMASIDHFFDLGNFYIIRGYLQSVQKELARSGVLPESRVTDVLVVADPVMHPPDPLHEPVKHRGAKRSARAME